VGWCESHLPVFAKIGFVATWCRINNYLSIDIIEWNSGNEDTFPITLKVFFMQD
jgi:hypothetical protein